LPGKAAAALEIDAVAGLEGDAVELVDAAPRLLLAAARCAVVAGFTVEVKRAARCACGE